jgi:glutamate-1-semialdehyde 2,1-aminomutase
MPDMICLAKAACGGFPGGAIGMNEALAEIVEAGTVHQYGTFNGNPLVMAAAQATLVDVLTPDAYERLWATNRQVMDGCTDIITRYGLPAHTQGLGSKGAVIFSSEPIHDYRDYVEKVDGELSTLAWLVHMNHGIFMTPGVEEEWTLSIFHTDEHVRRYLDAFELFAREVTGR